MIAHVADWPDVAHALADERLADGREGFGTEEPMPGGGRTDGGPAAGTLRGAGVSGVAGEASVRTARRAAIGNVWHAAAGEQPFHTLGGPAGEPRLQQVAVKRGDDVIHLGERIDHVDQPATTVEARERGQGAAGFEREHRAHALLAPAAVESVADVLPADAEMLLHDRLPGNAADLFQPGHGRGKVLDGGRRRAKEVIGAGPRPDLGMLIPQAVAGDDEGGGRIAEEMTDGGQRTAKRPPPGRRPHQRMLSKVGAEEGTRRAHLGCDRANHPRDVGGPAPVPELHIVANHVDKPIDPLLVFEEGVKRIDAAREAERRAGRDGRGSRSLPGRDTQRRRGVGIPEVAKGFRDAPGICRPGRAAARGHVELPPGVHRRHEERRTKRLGRLRER